MQIKCKTEWGGGGEFSCVSHASLQQERIFLLCCLLRIKIQSITIASTSFSALLAFTFANKLKQFILQKVTHSTDDSNSA
jgi:hypothetical protein